MLSPSHYTITPHHQCGTMRHLGDTSSGFVNDSCRNYYLMDPHLPLPPLPNWRHRTPKFIIAGACFLLVLIILVLIGRLLSEQHDDQPSTYEASFGKFQDPWTKNKVDQNSSVGVEKLFFSSWIFDKSGNITGTKISHGESQILERLYYQRTPDTNMTVSRKKKILTLSQLDINLKDLRKCKKNISEYCQFTTNKKEFNSADAVIFREQDFQELSAWLLGRKSSQIWIYNTISPVHKNKSIEFPKGIFNLTGTYHFASHIPMLPMYWDDQHASDNKTLPQKSKDDVVSLAVYNNNCAEEIKFYETFKKVIEGLEEENEIIVEWYNSHNCSENAPKEIMRLDDCQNKSSSQCYEKIGSKKKFALAFEIFKDYISERFFDPLNNGIVPIVIGSKRIKYEAVSPKNAFIYLYDYEASDLRKLLKRLNSSEDLNKYFKWRKNGKLQPFSLWYCQVCIMLHRTTNLTTFVEDINFWRGMD